MDLDDLLEPVIDAGLVGDLRRPSSRTRRAPCRPSGADFDRCTRAFFAHDASLPSVPAHAAGQARGDAQWQGERTHRRVLLPSRPGRGRRDRRARPPGERVGLTLADGRTLSALRYGDAAAGRHVPARRRAQRAHLGHDDPRARPAGARDRPPRARRLVVARRRRLHGARARAGRRGGYRGLDRPARSSSSGSRSAVSPPRRSRHPAPISCASSSSSTSPPASTRAPAPPRSASSSRARPTGPPATSSSTARCPSASGGTRTAAERGVFLNSRVRARRARRVEAPLRAPRRGDGRLAAELAAAAAAAAGCRRGRPSRDRLGRPRGGRCARTSSAATAASSARRTPPSSQERVPDGIRRGRRRRATTCRRSCRVELGQRAARLAGKG